MRSGRCGGYFLGPLHGVVAHADQLAGLRAGFAFAGRFRRTLRKRSSPSTVSAAFGLALLGLSRQSLLGLQGARKARAGQTPEERLAG